MATKNEAEKKENLECIRKAELLLKFNMFVNFTFCLINGCNLISNPLFLKLDFALLHSNDLIRKRAYGLLALFSLRMLLNEYSKIPSKEETFVVPYFEQKLNLEKIGKLLSFATGAYAIRSAYSLLGLKVINPKASRLFLFALLIMFMEREAILEFENVTGWRVLPEVG